MNKSSKVWQITKEELQKLANESGSITQLLLKLGFTNRGGGSYRTLMSRVKQDDILLNKNGRNKLVYRKIEDILVVNSPFSRGSLKRRIIKEKLIPYECGECGIHNIWNNKHLSLQIDHINGINNDNSLSNLRFLCPNCHSQTSNYAGKNLKNKRRDKCCKVCNKKISFNSKTCVSCWPRKRKVVRPTKEELCKLLWEIPSSKISKIFNVSDKAIGKWAKQYNLEKPSRGYWAKIKKKKI